MLCYLDDGGKKQTFMITRFFYRHQAQRMVDALRSIVDKNVPLPHSNRVSEGAASEAFSNWHPRELVLFGKRFTMAQVTTFVLIYFVAILALVFSGFIVLGVVLGLVAAIVPLVVARQLLPRDGNDR